MEEAGELTEKEIIRAERNAGFISDRVREIQVSKEVSNSTYTRLHRNYYLDICLAFACDASNSDVLS